MAESQAPTILAKIEQNGRTLKLEAPVEILELRQSIARSLRVDTGKITKEYAILYDDDLDVECEIVDQATYLQALRECCQKLVKLRVVRIDQNQPNLDTLKIIAEFQERLPWIVEIPAGGTFQDLKEEAFKISGYTKRDDQLWYNGYEMKDKDKFNKFGLHHGSTVYILPDSTLN